MLTLLAAARNPYRAGRSARGLIFQQGQQVIGNGHRGRALGQHFVAGGVDQAHAEAYLFAADHIGARQDRLAGTQGAGELAHVAGQDQLTRALVEADIAALAQFLVAIARVDQPARNFLGHLAGQGRGRFKIVDIGRSGAHDHDLGAGQGLALFFARAGIVARITHHQLIVQLLGNAVGGSGHRADSRGRQRKEQGSEHQNDHKKTAHDKPQRMVRNKSSTPASSRLMMSRLALLRQVDRAWA